MNDLLRSRLQDTGIVAIIRGVNQRQIPPLVQALYDGGIRIVEVTLNTDGAMASIEQLANQFADSMHVGAGTVLSAKKAMEARQHGAQFFVTPHVGNDVIRYGVESGIPVMAGAMTPTEIHTAYEAGASFVKVFPIGTLGARYLQEIRGPLSHIPLLAVGGVTRQNAAAFLQAGAVGWGLGGSLIDKAALEAGDFVAIAQNAHDFVDLYRKSKFGGKDGGVAVE